MGRLYKDHSPGLSGIEGPRVLLGEREEVQIVSRKIDREREMETRVSDCVRGWRDLSFIRCVWFHMIEKGGARGRREQFGDSS